MSSVSELGLDEQVHILQGQLQELNDRIETFEADRNRHRHLLVQISNRLQTFSIRQAEHDQQVRNFILAVHRAAEIYIRFTDF